MAARRPFVHVPDAAAYATFTEAGLVKVAWAICACRRGARVVVASTIEVRVDATDDASWERLPRYWLVVGPGSPPDPHAALAGPSLRGTAPWRIARTTRALPGDAAPRTQGVSRLTDHYRHATAESIWPSSFRWGVGAAGFYPRSSSATQGVPSARRDPSRPAAPAGGDVISATPEGSDGFEVLAIEPDPVRSSSRRPLRPRGRRQLAGLAGALARDGACRASRRRPRAHVDPCGVLAPAELHVLDAAAHHLMGRCSSTSEASRKPRAALGGGAANSRRDRWRGRRGRSHDDAPVPRSGQRRWAWTTRSRRAPIRAMSASRTEFLVDPRCRDRRAAPPRCGRGSRRSAPSRAASTTTSGSRTWWAATKSLGAERVHQVGGEGRRRPSHPGDAGDSRGRGRARSLPALPRRTRPGRKNRQETLGPAWRGFFILSLSVEAGVPLHQPLPQRRPPRISRLARLRRGHRAYRPGHGPAHAPRCVKKRAER